MRPANGTAGSVKAKRALVHSKHVPGARVSSFPFLVAFS